MTSNSEVVKYNSGFPGGQLLNYLRKPLHSSKRLLRMSFNTAGVNQSQMQPMTRDRKEKKGKKKKGEP